MNGLDADTDFAPHTIAAVNRSAVLDALERVGAPCSISELVHLTTLSRPTVSAAVAALGEAGVVAMDQPSTSTLRGGRPSRRYRLATDSRYVLSAVITPHGISARLCDLEDRVLVRRESDAILREQGAEEVLGHVVEVVREVCQESAAHPGTLSCIAVSVLGIVRDARTVVTSHSLPMLEGTALHDRLTAEFSLPVLIENDANCAALAEAAERPSVRAMIGMLAGQVLGCGIVLEGRLHRGAHGAAGELGSSQWTELLELLQSPGDASEILNVFDAASRGETEPVRFAKDVAEKVARLLSPAVEFLDPDLVVIGGEAAAAGTAITVPFQRGLERAIGWAPDVDVSSYADRTVATGVHILGSRVAYADLMGRREEQSETTSAHVSAHPTPQDTSVI